MYIYYVYRTIYIIYDIYIYIYNIYIYIYIIIRIQIITIIIIIVIIISYIYISIDNHIFIPFLQPGLHDIDAMELSEDDWRAKAVQHKAAVEDSRADGYRNGDFIGM